MTTVVNVTTKAETPADEWRLKIEQHGARFYGSLEAPGGREVALTRAQLTASDAVESATTWLLLHGLPNVCTALRESARAELRQ